MCSKINTGTLQLGSTRGGARKKQPKHRNNKERCTDLATERFGAFGLATSFGKEEERSKRKIMFVKKNIVLSLSCSDCSVGFCQ